jgi:hypothetical protein
VTGDIKQVWEPARLHYLSVLSPAHALTGDDRRAKRVASHRSWWRTNPWLAGTNWTSRIELPESLERRLAKGETNPLLGWYSPSFGVKAPAWSAVDAGTGNGVLQLLTTLRFYANGALNG